VDPEQQRQQLIELLQAREAELRTEAVQQFFRDQDLQTREQFVSQRGHLTGLIGELRVAQLQDIEQDMQRLAPDIQKSIDSLQRAIQDLQDSIAIVNTLSQVIGLVTRVVGFV
jgi:hypothetical protein